MKNLISLSTKRHVLILLCGIVIVGAATYFLTAQAVTVKTVGTLSSTLAPNSGGGAGTEFVEFSYSGPGEANLTKWTMKNDTGVFMNLTGVTVADGGKTRICEERSSDPQCDFHWEGNDVFNDSSDSLWVLDELDTSVINVSYSNSDISTVISSSADYKTAVYEKRDKVVICHESNKGLQSQDINVNVLVGSYERDSHNAHINHQTDIIPSFVYYDGIGHAFFPGKNWPDSSGVYANNCQ